MEPVEPSMESAFMKLAACVALPPWAKSSRCHSEESAHALVGAGDEVRCRDSGGVHRTPETGESAFARRTNFSLVRSPPERFLGRRGHLLMSSLSRALKRHASRN